MRVVLLKIFRISGDSLVRGRNILGGMRKTNLLFVGVALLGTALTLGGCSSGSTHQSGAKDDSTMSTDRDITTINGEIPPGRLLPLQDDFTRLDTVDANGLRLVVTQGTRLAGTRAAIHTHQYGGHTCVISGTITDFVEGHEPMVWPAGTCYYMPPNTLMTAANLGTEDAVLIDNFTLPVGAPTITIREPGWPS